MLAAAAVSAFVYVNNEKNSMSDLFNANVEALTNSESDYEDNIWYRYDRPDGGFNCTKVEIYIGITYMYFLVLFKTGKYSSGSTF